MVEEVKNIQLPAQPADNKQPASTEQNSALEETLLEDEQPYVETLPNLDGFFSDTTDQSAATVKVAVRVRPLVGRELRDGNKRLCTETPDTDRIQIGSKEFVFDRVFDMDSYQEDVFDVCTKNLILGCFGGYNATILAYGQTGSGKTHTMGTGGTVGLSSEQIGIVPRVFDFIFEEVENRRRQSEFSQFTIKVQFMELYGEELNDLLDTSALEGGTPIGDKGAGKSAKQIAIREEKNGAIRVDGLKMELVSSKADCLQLLNRGIKQRITSATLMNSESSRSHAIFTVTIEQKIVKQVMNEGEPSGGEAADEPQTSEENISAKFHFVDLAGSERIKKTGAKGKQMQEGIQINQGLLALGHVISALTDEKKVAGGKAFIPYRNSKLTRILQDSLGGNSRTTMIACVSPAESNFEETQGTVKYASRARNIKNKPIINRDANSMLIDSLRGQISHLQSEIGEYQHLLTSNSIEIPANLKEVAEAKSQAAQETKRQSIVAAPAQLNAHSDRSRGGGGTGSAANPQEVRDLKLKLARKERELREVQGMLAQMTLAKDESAKSLVSLQQERDELVLRVESLTEHIKVNNVSVPPVLPTTQTVSSGGKRTKSLLEEYKEKMVRFQSESERKTQELLAKSKKITELQNQMKRDEQLLKKAIDEQNRLKRAAKRPDREQNLQRSGQKERQKALEEVPDAESIKNQLMDKLTNQLENIFAAGAEQEPSEGGEEKKTGEADQTESEGAVSVAQDSINEVGKAKSLEDKEKMLSAVKQNADQIKRDLGDILQNTWSTKIATIQASMEQMTSEKQRQVKDGKQSAALEKEYKAKMDELRGQLGDQQRQKKKKEDALGKTLMQQESRLKAMEQEIQKMKKQRDELERQKKYGEERFTKFKSTAQKDLQAFKKTAQEKDKTVSKLKQDLKKTDQQMAQKISELKGLQRKARDEKEAREKQEEIENESKGIDVDAIKDWITLNTEQLLKQQELRDYLSKQQASRDEIEDEMLEEGDRLNELVIQKERLEFELQDLEQKQEEGSSDFDEARQLEIQAELEDIVIETESITQTLETLEEHLDFVQGKVNKLTQEIKSFDLDSIQAPRFKGLNSVEMARATLKTFFMVLLDVNVYKADLEQKCIEQDAEILDLRSQVTILGESSNLSANDRQLALRRQQAMRELISGMGEGTDFIDNRQTENMKLTQNEQSQLTKMSLTKIVSNLRTKLKEEEKKSRSVSNKLDMVLKEKEALKVKLQQLQKEVKRGGASTMRDSFSGSFTQPTPPRSGSASLSTVKSRINTGRAQEESKGPEPFTGYASGPSAARSQDARKKEPEMGRRMSFEQRRNLRKEQTQKKSEIEKTQENVNSLGKTVPGSRINTGRRQPVVAAPRTTTRPSTKQASGSLEGKSGSTGKSSSSGSSISKQTKEVDDSNFLTSPSMPETVVEVDEEGQASDGDGDGKDSGLPQVEEVENFGGAIGNTDISAIITMDTSMASGQMVNSSLMVDSSEVENEYGWKFEELVGLPMDEAQKVIGLETVENRAFVLFSDFALVEFNMEEKKIVREVLVADLDEATGALLQGKKASAFSLFKDIELLCISTDDQTHLFDFSEDLTLVKTKDIKNVIFVTFIEIHMVFVVESEDCSEATVLCQQLEEDDVEGQITIKQFVGQNLLFREGDNCLFFATGSQIGRIQLPEMELTFQEDSGHQIVDFAVTDTCIFTTGKDSSLRLFDSDQGMLLIEPMADMEIDSMAIQGQHMVARCGGGQAMMVFKYTDGAEELEEEDFIECEDLESETKPNSAFLMKGGVTVQQDSTEYNVILTASQTERGLLVKMLKNKSYAQM